MRTMTNEIETIDVVNFYRYSSLSDAVLGLGEEHFASEADVIRARNRMPFEDLVWHAQGLTRGMRLVPYGYGQPVLLVRDSMLLDNITAQRAEHANLADELFYPNRLFYEEQHAIALEDKDKAPEDRRVFIVTGRKDIQIQDGGHEALRFLAESEEEARTYFTRVQKERDIPELTIQIPPVNPAGLPDIRGTYVQQSRMNNGASDLLFVGIESSFDTSLEAFGVYRVVTEQNSNGGILLPYGNKDLNDAISTITAVRSGRSGINELQNVSEFLQRLPRNVSG